MIAGNQTIRKRSGKQLRSWSIFLAHHQKKCKKSFFILFLRGTVFVSSCNLIVFLQIYFLQIVSLRWIFFFIHASSIIQAPQRRHGALSILNISSAAGWRGNSSGVLITNERLTSHYYSAWDLEMEPPSHEEILQWAQVNWQVNRIRLSASAASPYISPKRILISGGQRQRRCCVLLSS